MTHPAEKGLPACEVHVPGRDEPSPWCAACRMSGAAPMPDAENDRPVIERRDHYTITVNGYPITADIEQERRLREMDAKQVTRFLLIMGCPIPKETDRA